MLSVGPGCGQTIKGARHDPDVPAGAYSSEVATVISDTIARWDGAEASRRIELQVGRDLQFIRINGTVVGALAGLAIHAITVLAG